MELFFELLAAFPNAKVILTVRATLGSHLARISCMSRAHLAHRSRISGVHLVCILRLSQSYARVSSLTKCDFHMPDCTRILQSSSRCTSSRPYLPQTIARI
eukprot:6189928-Pleurochrysis_carterae.AAC.2